MTKPTKFAHVILRTPDVLRAAGWYKKALDAHVVVDNLPMMQFLTYDEEHHRIGFVQSPPGSPDAAARPARGLEHLAFAFGSARDLLSKYTELKASGVTPAFSIHHGPTLSSYYHDADGNVVEFFADRFATMEDADAFMATPLFRENPIGKTVDMDALAARAGAGADESELLDYPDGDVDVWGLAAEMNAALEARP